MKSKTIILSSNKKFENNSPRAILTLITENSYMDGKIRLYNMKDLQKGVKLGIYYNNEVLSANLFKDRDAYNFKLDKNIDLNKDVYCALVDTLNKNDVLLSGGNGLGFCFSAEEDETDDEEYTVEEETIHEKPTLKSSNTECNKYCKNCVYKKFFYEHQESLKINQNLNNHSTKIDSGFANNANNNYPQIENETYLENFENDITFGYETNDSETNLNRQENFTNKRKFSYEQDIFSREGILEDENGCLIYDSNAKINNPQRQDKCYNLFEDQCLDYESFENLQNNLSKQNRNSFEENSNNVFTNSKNENIKVNRNQENNNSNLSHATETEKFISAIAEQLDELFASYPVDQEIMAIIPNSKVVRVTDSFDNCSYVVGVIYEEDKIAYLLYGVPGKYDSPPPIELGENYQWLALNPDNPMSDGYFLIYQDASTGKLVPIRVV